MGCFQKLSRVQNSLVGGGNMCKVVNLLSYKAKPKDKELKRRKEDNEKVLRKYKLGGRK